MYCCFCKKEISGFGNSTWPIFMEKDAEFHRCCNDCNFKYIITSRLDKTKIMNIRNQFNIEYEGDILK